VNYLKTHKGTNMATSKKKDNGTLSGFPKDYPYVTIGTHLTVIEYEDGRTELEWDDEALLSEVRNAILKAESVLPVAETKPKKTKKAKA
jgi:hypothetical protein